MNSDGSTETGIYFSGRTRGSTVGQSTGVEANPVGPDSINGFLNRPDTNEASVSPFFAAPAQGSDWTYKKREILKQMALARRRIR